MIIKLDYGCSSSLLLLLSNPCRLQIASLTKFEIHTCVYEGGHMCLRKKWRETLVPLKHRLDWNLQEIFIMWKKSGGEILRPIMFFQYTCWNAGLFSSWHPSGPFSPSVLILWENKAFIWKTEANERLTEALYFKWLHYQVKWHCPLLWSTGR